MNKVMKLFVTPEYFEKSQQKIHELNAQLTQIRHDKTAAYTEDTNTWHDNFAYEHLTRMEKQTQKQIADLMADLDNMHVVPAVVPSVTNSVGLYCSVCVTVENEGTGDQTTCRYGIVPLGAECIADKIYAYNIRMKKEK